MNLGSNVEVLVVNDPIAAADDTDDNSTIVDTNDCEGVIFIATITDSVQNGVAALTVQQNTANQDSGMAAVAGGVATATSATNDDLNGTALVVDIFRPRERYVQGVLTSSGANIAYGNTIAIKYGLRKYPKTQGATVSDSAVVASPAES